MENKNDSPESTDIVDSIYSLSEQHLSSVAYADNAQWRTSSEKWKNEFNGNDARREEAASRSELDCEIDTPGPVNGFWGDAEWIYCRDGKYRATKPGICPLADVSPKRMAILRGAGDAIVAEVAINFIQAYLEAKEEMKILPMLTTFRSDDTEEQANNIDKEVIQETIKEEEPPCLFCGASFGWCNRNPLLHEDCCCGDLCGNTLG